LVRSASSAIPPTDPAALEELGFFGRDHVLLDSLIATLACAAAGEELRSSAKTSSWLPEDIVAPPTTEPVAEGDFNARTSTAFSVTYELVADRSSASRRLHTGAVA
jgi:hypothetical protein